MSRLFIKASANQDLEVKRDALSGNVDVVVYYFGVVHSIVTLTPAQANDVGTWLFATEPL